MNLLLRLVMLIFAAWLGHAPAIPRYTSGLHARYSANTKMFTFDELWNLQTNLWDNFLYLANVKQAESISSTIFFRGCL